MSEGNRQPAPAEPTEVCCNRCHQTFLAPDPAEPLHVQRRDGQLCGGTGVPFRPFVIRNPNRW